MKDYSKTIETKRLILRKFTSDDYKDVYNNYASKSEVTKFMSWTPHKSVDETISFINDIVLPEYSKEHTYSWAIVLKKTNQVVGSIDVVNKNLKRKNAELGFVLGNDYWGIGIMPEAAKAVVSYLFEEGFVRVYALHHVDNLKSGRVMQKIGMSHEGTLKKATKDKNGSFVDCELYAITI